MFHQHGTKIIYFTGCHPKRRYTADGANSCTSLPVGKGANQMVIVEIELLYISLLRINYNTQDKIDTSYRIILYGPYFMYLTV